MSLYDYRDHMNSKYMKIEPRFLERYNQLYELNSVARLKLIYTQSVKDGINLNTYMNYDHTAIQNKINLFELHNYVYKTTSNIIEGDQDINCERLNLDPSLKIKKENLSDLMTH